MNISNLHKSIIITLVGYLFGLVGQVVIYPLFGISLDLFNVLVLGCIFTGIALCSNYLCFKVFDLIEKEKP